MGPVSPSSVRRFTRKQRLCQCGGKVTGCACNCSDCKLLGMGRSFQTFYWSYYGSVKMADASPRGILSNAEGVRLAVVSGTIRALRHRRVSTWTWLERATDQAA